MNRDEALQHISRSISHGAASVVDHGISLSRLRLIDAVIAAQDADPRTTDRLRERVVLATCRLVHKIARTEYMSWHAMLPASVDYCYVFNAGMEGLTIALNKYDRTKLNDDGEPFAFTTYADKWIRQAAQRCIYSQCTHMKVGWERIRTQGASIGMGLAIGDVSVDMPVGDGGAARDGSDSTLGDLLIDTAEHGYEDVESAMMVDAIIDRVDELDLSKPSAARRRKILRMAADGYNQKEIGAALDMTGERVRQLLGKTGWELEMLDEECCV